MLTLAGSACDPIVIQKTAEGPLFSRHAKLGGAFSEGQGTAVTDSFAQEAQQVAQWIGMIAQQAGMGQRVQEVP